MINTKMMISPSAVSGDPFFVSRRGLDQFIEADDVIQATWQKPVSQAP